MKLVILDRDGVINYDSDNYIKSVDEFVTLPGSVEAIAKLKQAGYTVAIATNQSGIARGYYDIATLDAMHQKLADELSTFNTSVDLITYCPHGPDDQCNCRKPKPGMMHQIAAHFDLKIDATVYVIGDSLRDIDAGIAVGATPVLVKTGKGERTIAKGLPFDGIAIYDDLSSFVNQLLQEM